MILLSRAEEIVLLAVFKLEGNAYGVTIREQIYKDIGQRWSFGAVYKTLKKIKNKEFVKRIPSDPVAERGGRSRFYYEMTPEGISALKEIRKVHSSIWEGAQSLSFDKKVD
jgi:PadR family transcriptional regulator PadR